MKVFLGMCSTLFNSPKPYQVAFGEKELYYSRNSECHYWQGQA